MKILRTCILPKYKCVLCGVSKVYYDVGGEFVLRYRYEQLALAFYLAQRFQRKEALMKISAFIEKLQKRTYIHRPICNSYYGTDYNIPWDYKFWLCSLTEDLNYGCDFVGELCSRDRNSLNKKDSQVNRSKCCSQCQAHMGHILQLPDNEFHLFEIAHRFDEEYGFYRPKMGCILPRKYRSPTCLGLCYYLQQDHNYLDTRGKTIIAAIKNIEYAWAMAGWDIKFDRPVPKRMYCK